MHAPPPAEPALSQTELGEARAKHVADRLPALALVNLAATAVWLSSLVAAGDVGVRAAAATLLFQLVVLGVALRLCPRHTPTPHVVPVTVAAIALVGLSWVALFAFAQASGLVLGFVVFTVFVGAGVATAWGFGPQLAVQVPVTTGWLLALPAITKRLSTSERIAAAGIGSVIALVIAEWAARTFREELRRRRAEVDLATELAASRDAFRDLYENARDFIWMADLRGRLTYVNTAVARLRDEPADAIVGRTVADLLTDHAENPPPAEWRSGIARILAGETLPTMVVQVRAAGGPRWVESLVSPVRERSGRVTGLQATSRDITERREAEEALRVSEMRARSLIEQLVESEGKLRMLAQRQVSVREDERTRLGFDLHDGVCQELVGVTIIVEAARQRLETQPLGVANDLARAGEYLREIVEHLRRVARELRPILLHDLGLEDSLRSLAHGLATAETAVEASFPTPIPRLRHDVELAVYRIAQEAMSNALRHAAARTITLTLSATPAVLTLEVRDDGCGFEREQRRIHALGLLSMEERALAANGRLEIDSEPRRGTTIRLRCTLA